MIKWTKTARPYHPLGKINPLGIFVGFQTLILTAKKANGTGKKKRKGINGKNTKSSLAVRLLCETDTDIFTPHM